MTFHRRIDFNTIAHINKLGERDPNAPNPKLALGGNARIRLAAMWRGRRVSLPARSG
jgi:hypothetical protein